jgi:hypothetical protein
MMILITIAAALLFAVIGIRLGYYRIWALLFNILVSIYLAVMLAPVIPGLIPNVKDFHYRYPAFVIAAAIIIFAALQSFAIYLIGTFEASYHRKFDLISSAVLGFISGYLLGAFVFFVICLIPFTKPNLISWQDKSTARASQPVISACNLIGNISIHVCDNTACGVVDKLINARNELAGLHQQEPYETEEAYD